MTKKLLILASLLVALATTTACTDTESPSETVKSKTPQKKVVKPLSADDQGHIDALKMRVNVTNERKALKDLREVCKYQALVSPAAAKRAAIRLFADQKIDPNDYTAMDYTVGVASMVCDWRTGK